VLLGLFALACAPGDERAHAAWQAPVLSMVSGQLLPTIRARAPSPAAKVTSVRVRA
jgi:hypothetical protein